MHNGVKCGAGLAHHYKALISALWPHWQWHRWSNLLIESFAEGWLSAVLGPASSGKTACGAVFALADYWTFPNKSTWIVSSTTLPALERRVWGEIKKRFREARARHPWLPGRVVDSRHMVTTETIETDDDIRDIRNGILCVACLQGSTFVGLGNYVGVKNERIRQLADELQFMPAAFVDTISNYAKNEDYKCIGFGNPKDRTDSLGKIAEPEAAMGGWDGVPDSKKTQSWKTRFAHPLRGPGRAIQLDGRDTPNNDFPRGTNPYKFLIKAEDIESDEGIFGADSIQVAMMDYGRMPKDAQARRVISRKLCEGNHAFEQAVWDGSTPFTEIGCLDAAYSGVGGDRTPFLHLRMGKLVTGTMALAIMGNPIIVPVTDKGAEPTDQIALFVKKLCEERNIPPEHLFYDGTGRSSLTSSFARLWSPFIVPIEFGGKPTNRPLGKTADCSKRFKKFVSELWFATADLISAGQLRQLPESVAEEGYLRAWDLFDGGFEDVEPKDEMKVRLGRSPDLYDSFVCGVEGARRLGFRILAPMSKEAIERKTTSWVATRADTFRRLHQQQQLTFA